MTQVAHPFTTATDICVTTTARVAYLFFDGTVHALEHPYDPAALDDLANEPKCPWFRRGCTHFFLLRANGEKVLEEPLCDEEQAEMILLSYLWALRLDVLEQRREESCMGGEISISVITFSLGPTPARPFILSLSNRHMCKGAVGKK